MGKGKLGFFVEMCASIVCAAEINLYLAGTYGNPRRARNGEVVGSKRSPAMNP